jgi:hypothetical protein
VRTRRTRQPPPFRRKRLEIGTYARRLLEVIDYWEDRDQPRGPSNRFATLGVCEGKPSSVGLSYAEIIRRVRLKFPSAKTTPGSMRWYAAGCRSGNARSGGVTRFPGIKLPQRRPNPYEARR